MASKRKLKKDIDKLIYEIVADCYSYMELYPKADHQPLKDMATRALDLQDETIAKINTHKGANDPKDTKEHFNTIQKEFLEEANKMFNELDEFYKAREKE